MERRKTLSCLFKHGGHERKDADMQRNPVKYAVDVMVVVICLVSIEAQRSRHAKFLASCSAPIPHAAQSIPRYVFSPLQPNTSSLISSLHLTKAFLSLTRPTARLRSLRCAQLVQLTHVSNLSKEPLVCVVDMREVTHCPRYRSRIRDGACRLYVLAMAQTRM